MWGGSLTFETPMLWAIGFLVTFLFGGLTGHHPVQPGAGLPPVRLLLRGGALPLRRVRHRGVRDVRRVLLLVAEVHRPDAGRELGKIHFWMLFIGFHTTFLIQHWLGVIGHAAPLRGLPARGRLHLDEPGLQRRRAAARAVHAAVPVQRLEDLAHRAAGRDRRPVGLRRLAGVGHLLPAAAAQLRVDPAHPLRAAGVRPAPPRGRRPGPAAPTRARWTACSASRSSSRSTSGQHTADADVTIRRGPRGPGSAGTRVQREWRSKLGGSGSPMPRQVLDDGG